MNQYDIVLPCYRSTPVVGYRPSPQKNTAWTTMSSCALGIARCAEPVVTYGRRLPLLGRDCPTKLAMSRDGRGSALVARPADDG